MVQVAYRPKLQQEVAQKAVGSAGFGEDSRDVLGERLQRNSERRLHKDSALEHIARLELQKQSEI